MEYTEAKEQLAEIFKREGLDDGICVAPSLADELLEKIYEGFKTKLHHVRHDAQKEIIRQREELNQDKLAELEKVILDHYLSKGYKLKKDQTENDTEWFFKVVTCSAYKDKLLYVYFYTWNESKNDWEETEYMQIDARTTKELFDAAFEFFTIEENQEAKAS